MSGEWRPDTSRGFTDLKVLVNDEGGVMYMCQLCYEHFPMDELADCDEPGFRKADICKACDEMERRHAG